MENRARGTGGGADLFGEKGKGVGGGGETEGEKKRDVYKERQTGRQKDVW